MQHRIGRITHARNGLHDALGGVQGLLVRGLHAQPGQPLGETADGRRVGTAIVIDHHDQRTVLPGGDIVQRLPAHTAGQRAVADDRDHVAFLAGQRERLGQSVRIGQRGRRMRGLDPVVRALRPARIAGEATDLAERVETVLTAGEDLVHIGLMAGVEDDRIGWRIEDPVQRDGQLHDTEVRSEVPAGDGDLPHQELANLLGQLAQLRYRQPTQVLGHVDPGKHSHGYCSLRMSPVIATVYGDPTGPRRQELNATCDIRNECEAPHTLPGYSGRVVPPIPATNGPARVSHGVVANIIHEVYELCRSDTSGELADYIPELAAVQPDSFGICLATADGRIYGSGDLDTCFTIQSISKPFTYALALADRGLPRSRSASTWSPPGNRSTKSVWTPRHSGRAIR